MTGTRLIQPDVIERQWSVKAELWTGCSNMETSGYIYMPKKRYFPNHNMTLIRDVNREYPHHRYTIDVQGMSCSLSNVIRAFSSVL